MQTSVANPMPDPEGGIEELLSITREVATGQPPQRLAAVRYMVCRDMILASGSRDELPGFLQQCVSIFKFHDFIHLYHPSVPARLAFLEEAFGGCRALSASRRTFDVFGDDEEDF